MRVVVDTNLFVSGLISPTGRPAVIYTAWEERSFTLLTCPELLDELRATLRKSRVAKFILPHKAGRLVNEIRKFAVVVGPLPNVRSSLDPTDDILLALAEAGGADYLVTGDKAGPLVLRRHKSTQIVTAASFLKLAL